MEDPRAVQRIEIYKQLNAAGTLDPVAQCGPHLYCHVVSRLVNAHEDQEHVSVADILTHAIDHGHPQLAQEAQACFDQNGYKAGRQSGGSVPEALLLPDQEPQGEDQLLRGSVRVSGSLYPKSLALPYEDHQDRLPVAPGAPPLFPKAEVDELGNASVCTLGTHSLATSLRSELREEASAAQGHLGDAPPMISEAEAFVRHNTHDCLAPHHEKDYRVLQLFAPKFMSGRTRDFACVLHGALGGRSPARWRSCNSVESCCHPSWSHADSPASVFPSTGARGAFLRAWASCARPRGLWLGILP